MKTIPHTRSNKAVAASALALLLALPVHAATFTLNPSADAFITTGPSGTLSGKKGLEPNGLSDNQLSAGSWREWHRVSALQVEMNWTADEWSVAPASSPEAQGIMLPHQI